MAETATTAPAAERRPAPIDVRGPRFAAAVTSVVLAAVLLAPPAVSVPLLVWQASAFALGAAGHGPYGWAFRRVVRPSLGPVRETEDPRPPRFAQVVGLVFALVALAGFAAGWPALSLGALALALVAALLNATVGFCLGCHAYVLLQRLRPA